MSTETPTPAAPGAPAPVTPPAPAGEPAANAAFAQMRTELAALKAQNEALAAEKTALERKDMDEKTRLQAERDDLDKKVRDLEPLRDELGRYTSEIEKACDNALNAIPEEKRAAIKAVTDQIPLDGRLTAIQTMTAAIGVAPISGGTVTQPGFNPNAGLPGAPEDAKPLENKELQALPWKVAVMSRGVKGEAGLAQTVADLQNEVKALTAALKK